jgi:pimeloyl-ACP methyl ester carboxylesterase
LEEVKASQGDCQLELDAYVAELERQLGVAFAHGYNPSLTCIRQMLTPVQSEHRPLVFYAIIALGCLIVDTLFYAIGFRWYSIDVPGRVPTFGYWYHPGSARSTDANSSSVPVVVVSGLGGLVCMPQFVVGLWLSVQHPLFLVGNPYVGLRLHSTGLVRSRGSRDKEAFERMGSGEEGKWWEALREPEKGWESNVLDVAEVASSVRRMLFRHGFISDSERPSRLRTEEGVRKGTSGAVFVSHSLGTALASYLCRADPDLVAGNVLVDPVCLLLHSGGLVRSFLYTTPRTFDQLLVKLFARELGIAQ